MATVVDTLKKDLKRAKGVEAGTVVRFTRCFEADLLKREDAKRYNYAAIFVNSRWYMTGERNNEWFRNEAFLELLVDDSVEDVEVATGWESIK